MGFRSTLITQHYRGIKVPDWYTEKHNYLVALGRDNEGNKTFPIASISEAKYYSDFNTDERFLDIQKILKENDVSFGMDIVLLHECGGVTHILVSATEITANEPSSWNDVQEVNHDYCYSCSEPDEARKNDDTRVELSPKEEIIN